MVFLIKKTCIEKYVLCNITLLIHFKLVAMGIRRNVLDFNKSGNFTKTYLKPQNMTRFSPLMTMISNMCYAKSLYDTHKKLS